MDQIMHDNKNSTYIVIYGGTKEERLHFVEQQLKHKPECRTEINPVFSQTVKFGPFVTKNKKSIYQIFMSSPVYGKMATNRY